jgi:hypothetical protein
VEFFPKEKLAIFIENASPENLKQQRHKSSVATQTQAKKNNIPRTFKE